MGAVGRAGWAVDAAVCGGGGVSPGSPAAASVDLHCATTSSLTRPAEARDSMPGGGGGNKGGRTAPVPEMAPGNG